VPGPIVYIDHSEVREGRLDELRDALRELAAWVEDNEPWLAGYSVYFSDDGRRFSVIHVHADPASLAMHLETAGPRFAPFAELVNLLRIDVYGDPGEAIVERLRDKARLLGTGTVAVHPFHAGFARLSPI
jgi:quinol monooxygenase YgiN